MNHPYVVRRERQEKSAPAELLRAPVTFGWANLKASVEAEFRCFGLVDDGFRARRSRRYGAA